MSRLKVYADLADLPEDERIDIIGRTVMEQGLTVAVAVDSDRDKMERYIRKLLKRFPGIRILERLPGIVSGTLTIKVGPPDPENN